MKEKDYVDEIEESFVNAYANSYTLDQLKEIRDRLIKMNADTSIVDKSINLKISNQKLKDKQAKDFERRVRIVNKQAFWSGLLGGLTSGKKLNKDLTSWEMQEMINNDLEVSNFEEEIEDEDDFYSDDLD